MPPEEATSFAPNRGPSSCSSFDAAGLVEGYKVERGGDARGRGGEVPYKTLAPLIRDWEEKEPDGAA